MTDAAVEKHVPVYTVDKQYVHVVVGETKHPMLEEHFIEWITLNTNQGIYRKQLINGYIVAGENTETSIPGVYAVGDVRTKLLRQIVTAVADGAMAVHMAEEYMEK